jgi:hypothetical protein
MGDRRVGTLDDDVDGAADVDPGLVLAADGELDGEDFDDGGIDIDGAAFEGFADGFNDIDGAADDLGEGIDDGDFDVDGTGLAANGELDGEFFKGPVATLEIFRKPFPWLYLRGKPHAPHMDELYGV